MKALSLYSGGVDGLSLGSLFDGIGGFPYAASLLGIKPAWASEIEPACVSITKRHFPGMKHLGDITQINGAEIEPVDIITFGSPCQDLSVAGKRDGMKHEDLGDEETTRSGLFMEAIRIINEMRDATDGRFPTWAIWENVPGALSSNDGLDFRAVLQSFAGTEIPMPGTGRWAGAGMVRGGRCDLGWRILDAQYWGVPQRRRRIFLVADFGGRRAGQVCFKPESLRGHFEACGAAGEGLAGRACNGLAAANDNDTGRPTGGVGPVANDNVLWPDVARTLDGAEPCAACIGIDSEQNALIDKMGTLRAHASGGAEQYVATFSFQSYSEYAENTVARTVSARDFKSATDLVVGSQIVRRLTPTECERLQGFPDQWTALGHNDKPITDSKRYAALGNSVAIPCVAYFLAGIAEAERRMTDAL